MAVNSVVRAVAAAGTVWLAGTIWLAGIVALAVGIAAGPWTLVSPCAERWLAGWRWSVTTSAPVIAAVSRSEAPAGAIALA